MAAIAALQLLHIGLLNRKPFVFAIHLWLFTLAESFVEGIAGAADGADRVALAGR
jgi:hypothetical protein